MFLIFRGAVLFWVAFFFLELTILIQSDAAEQLRQSKTKETAKDLIDKAQNLILQRDRLKASRVLQQGINTKDYSAENRKKLRRSLIKISTLFLSEKGQQAFQLADSMYFTEEPKVLIKYEEALQLEPQNILVIGALARAQLKENKCTMALQSLQRGDDINPFDSDLKYYQIRALYCLNRRTQARVIRSRAKGAMGKYKIYLIQLDIENAMKENNKQRAYSFAKKALNMDKKYPETYYWLWRTRPIEEELEVEDAQRYLELCKSLGPPLRRKYSFNPHLCQYTVEIDDFIKKRVSN